MSIFYSQPYVGFSIPIVILFIVFWIYIIRYKGIRNAEDIEKNLEQEKYDVGILRDTMNQLDEKYEDVLVKKTNLLSITSGLKAESFRKYITSETDKLAYRDGALSALNIFSWEMDPYKEADEYNELTESIMKHIEKITKDNGIDVEPWFAKDLAFIVISGFSDRLESVKKELTKVYSENE